MSFPSLLILMMIFSSSSVFANTQYSFQEAFQKILERNTALKIQETKVEASDWTRFSKKMGYLPTVQLYGSQTSPGQSSTSSTQTAGATANLNLFKWGMDYFNIKAAGDDYWGQKHNLNNIELSAEQEAIEVLSTLVEKQISMEILKQNRDAFKTYLDIAHLRFARGLLPQQEVDKVAIDLANADARVYDSQSRLAVAEQNLERLLGDGKIDAVWPWKESLIHLNENFINEVTVNLDSRPDIKSAKSFLAAEEERMTAEHRSIFPALNLSYSPSFSQYVGGSNYSSATTIGLTVPLFDSFQDFASYKIQYQNFLARDYSYRQLKIDAEAQWRAAKKKLSIALTTAQAREKTLDISQRIYASNQQRAKQGRASANDLALDLTRLVDSQLLAVQGWSTAHTELSGFCHAQGKSIKGTGLLSRDNSRESNPVPVTKYCSD